jgi:dimethylargininase
LRSFLTPFGYTVREVPVSGCLHLKSAITQVAAKALLINPEWVNRVHFEGMQFIEVEPSEAYAANALLVGESVVYTPAYPKTIERLKAAGIQPLLVDQAELAKAEGALTCCSLIFEAESSN